MHACRPHIKAPYRAVPSLAVRSQGSRARGKRRQPPPHQSACMAQQQQLQPSAGGQRPITGSPVPSKKVQMQGGDQMYAQTLHAQATHPTKPAGKQQAKQNFKQSQSGGGSGGQHAADGSASAHQPLCAMQDEHQDQQRGLACHRTTALPGQQHAHRPNEAALVPAVARQVGVCMVSACKCIACRHGPLRLLCMICFSTLLASVVLRPLPNTRASFAGACGACWYAGCSAQFNGLP
jgi:hypothetical protein